MNYLVLIGDLKKSKGVADRNRVQAHLRDACTGLNDRMKNLHLVSPFTVTLGDEFQAVFSSPKSVWPGIFEIESRLRPVRVRFGMGVGAIDTEINPAMAIGMDGPAFHLARDAISSLKEEGENYRVLGLKNAQTLANQALDLVSHIRDGWRDNRVAIFSFLLNGMSVTQMADKLAITEQAVYKNINEGRLETIQGIFRGLNSVIETQLGEQS